MNLKFFKLTNGEEFIGELLSESTEGLVIQQPVILSMSGSNANFVLWCPLRKEREFTIKHDLIMIHGSVDDSLMDEYSRLFKFTTIQTPDQGFGSVRAKGASSIITTK